MRPTFRLVALAVVGLLLVAPAQAQINNPNDSTATTLYFHVFDTYNKFVINTQAMDADFFEVGGSNFPTLVGTPVNTVAGGDFDLNTVYGTSTAGPVEYDFIENGKPRFHPEPGIAQDVQIDASVDPIVYLYLDVKDVFGLDGFPNTLPMFTMEVTIREGDDPGEDANLDDGALIMSGKTTAHVVDSWTSPGMWVNGMTCALPGCSQEEGWFVPAPTEGAAPLNEQFAGQAGPDGNPILVPDESGIVEVAIPMTIDQPVIPKKEAFNIRIDWYQELNGAFGPDEFSEGFFRLAADPEHLPRMEFAITNPVYIEFIHPQVAAGTLLIHTGVNSPWGTYDIDADNVTIKVDGPSTPLSLEQVVAQNQHVHGLHDQAAEITYLWKFRDEGAENGDYTIEFSVPNADGTAVATGTAGFTIQGREAFGIDTEGDVVEATAHDEGKDSPAGFLLVAGMLGAALLARRRIA